MENEERKIYGLNTNNELMVVNFATHKPPVFVERKDTEWIVFGNEPGFVNLYPQYLIELYNRANTHNSLINAKVHYIAGNGVDIDLVGLNIERKSLLIHELGKVNRYGETISDIALKLAADFEISDSCYVEVVWAKNKKDFDFYHVDFTKIRRSKDENGWFYSNDWSRAKNKQTIEDTNFHFIPDFDAANPIGKQILALRNYRPAMKWYTLPSYIAAIPYAEIDWEIANFHATGIKSGFYAGTILTLFGQKPTAEEKDSFYDAARDSFTGTDRANSLFIINARTKDDAPQLVRLTPDNIHEQFTSLKTDTSEQLFLGHRMSKILLGMQTAGTLGQRNELIEAFELFKNTYVKPRQYRLNNFLNDILSYKGFDGRVHLREVDAISIFEPADLIKVMTVDEIRERVGLPPLPKEEKVAIATSMHHQFNDCCADKFTEQDMSNELTALAQVIPEFESCGANKDEFETLETIEVNENGMAITKSNFAEAITDELKTVYKNILELINKDGLIDAVTISKILKKKEAQIQTAIEYLIENEYIKEGTKTSGDDKITKYKLTDDGNNAIEGNDSRMANIKILYSYEPRPGLPSLIAGSRPFCRALIELNKYYSRAEIETISMKVNRNVWEMRGGWWRKKGKDGALYPFCRHIWVQNVVKEKK